MEKMTDNDVTLMWFDKLVEAQRNYLEVAGDAICIGVLDDTIHMSRYDEFMKLAELLDKEVSYEEDWDPNEKYIRYAFRYEEFTVTCLVTNAGGKEEENNG